MPEQDYNADELANQLMTSLLANEDLDMTFEPLPDYPFDFSSDNPIFSQISKLTTADLTTGTVNGTGVFDVVMRSFKAHLEQEYKANRITGAEYARTYIALTTAAMSGSVQFLLGRDQAFWAAANAQIAGANALTELAIAKMKYQVAQIELKTGRANFALTKIKLGTEAMGLGAARFQIEQMLPVQKTLLEEQVEVQRAQTLDTRTDGATIVGQVGKQKALYDQQITSYQRSSELGVAKLFSDAWITQKTLDEGLLAPTQFNNENVNEVLEAVKSSIGMGTVP